MSTIATLDSANVSLAPGGEVVIPLQVRNNGETVEGYRFEVVGSPGAWATVEPETISLYPGTSTTATVSFRPPRSAHVAAGEQQYGVIVTPTEHPDEAVVPEGVVEVLPYFETTAELLPRTSHGRRRGRHEVAVDNRGNVPVTVVLDASDPATALDFKVDPPALTVAAGHASYAGIRAKSTKRLWRGAPVTHPFTVIVGPQDGQAVTLEGTHLQEPILPPWFAKALLAALALLVALAAIWFFVLKPTIESAAKEAVEEPVAEAKEEAGAAQAEAQEATEAAGAAQESAGAAQGAAGDAQESATTAGELVGDPPPPRTVTSPVARRLDVETAKGETTSESFTVPRRSQMELSDLVMSNPQGDFGRVRVSLDDRMLFDLALENFRDIDYHFVAPIRARAGQELTIRVACNEVGVPPGQTPPPSSCSTGMYFGGEMTRRTANRRTNDS